MTFAKSHSPQAKPPKGINFGTRGQGLLCSKAMETPGELGVIEGIRRASGTRNPLIRLGIGDDCAVLRPPRGQELLLTTDFSLEGRHFRQDWHPAESVGHRCLARGLSDLAAMGGQPIAAFLSLALPRGYDPAWLAGFLAGFNRLAAHFGVELAGGDTAQAPGEQILADIVLTGSAPRGTALLRSGARPGDHLYVTGSLGGSAVELERLKEGAGFAARFGGSHPHLYPEPRLAVGQALRRRGLATACMDLSDGLSSDIHRLTEASQVTAKINEAAIPLSAGGTLTQALDGGEDYELLFTAGPETRMPRRLGGVAITRIGEVGAVTPGSKPWALLVGSTLR